MNYTKEETENLVELYNNNTSIEELAQRFEKSKRSIIGKLSREGVYRKETYKSKSGEDPVTKLELVVEMSEILGIDLPGLEKSPKQTLRIILEKLRAMSEEI